MARYSLFVLKVPLNPKQINKQTMYVIGIAQKGIWPKLLSCFSKRPALDMIWCAQH